MVVVLLLNRPEAPDPGAVNVTLTPATGLLPASRTVTASALAKAVLTVADCGVVPALAVIVVALPAVLVSEKLTLVSPLAAAVTVYGPPAVALAVNGAAATPDALVATVIVVVLLENRPEAPDPGAVNVTLTPATGLLPASRTVTASALAKAVLTVADCGVVPALAVIVVALPAVLVSEKLTVVRPVAAAVTVYGPPAVALAVNGAAATPDALVATVIVVVLLENRPDAPLPGAVNVTLTPGTGLLPASRTVTASALAEAVLTGAADRRRLRRGAGIRRHRRRTARGVGQREVDGGETRCRRGHRVRATGGGVGGERRRRHAGCIGGHRDRRGAVGEQTRCAATRRRERYAHPRHRVAAGIAHGHRQRVGKGGAHRRRLRRGAGIRRHRRCCARGVGQREVDAGESAGRRGHRVRAAGGGVGGEWCGGHAGCLGGHRDRTGAVGEQPRCAATRRRERYAHPRHRVAAGIAHGHRQRVGKGGAHRRRLRRGAGLRRHRRCCARGVGQREVDAGESGGRRGPRARAAGGGVGGEWCGGHAGCIGGHRDRRGAVGEQPRCAATRRRERYAHPRHRVAAGIAHGHRQRVGKGGAHRRRLRRGAGIRRHRRCCARGVGQREVDAGESAGRRGHRV